MGRSLNFTHKTIKLPNPTSWARVLKKLKCGDVITLEFSKTSSDGVVINNNYFFPRSLSPCPLLRSPSTYGKLNTPIIRGIYIVVDTDCDPDIKNVGIRSLAVRNICYDPNDYFLDWFITTDGFVREIEACGISHCVKHMRVLNNIGSCHIGL